MNNATITTGLIFLLTLLSTTVLAVDAPTRWAFWDHVAPLGTGLYCEDSIADLRAQDRHSIEHVYPLSWMRQTLGCSGAACEADPAFVRFDNDLHNLWPADRSINSARGNRGYADLVPADDWRDGTCGFRSRGGRETGVLDFEGWVEPRDEVKGQVARSLLYVHEVHGGRLPDGQLDTALRWHQEYPTTELECARAVVILDLQGAVNPFLDCP